MADPIIPRLIREHGPKLINKALNTDIATGAPKTPSFGRKLANGLLMRVATKSVPGAIVVGGIMLARHFHDRRKLAATQKAGDEKPS